MANITLQEINSGYDKLDEIKKIYEEAFPATERVLSLEEYLALNEKEEAIRIVSAVEDGAIAGFYIVMETEEWVFLCNFAIRSDLRGGGYGTIIMKAMLEEYPDKTIIFLIETPIERAHNYVQRVKREAFYTKLGCVTTDYSIDADGDNYTFMCSKMSDKVRAYIDDYVRIYDRYMASSTQILNEDSKMEDIKNKITDKEDCTNGFLSDPLEPCEIRPADGTIVIE